MKNILGLIFISSFLACQPIQSAADVAHSACESGLIQETAVKVEAEFRNVPVVDLVKKFCTIEEIWSLWTDNSKKASDVPPEKNAVNRLVQRGEIHSTE